MKRNKIICILIEFVFLATFFIFTIPYAFAEAEAGTLYDAQMRRYNGISEDSYFKKEKKWSGFEGQYELNTQKYQRLKQENERVLRFYDEQQIINKRLRKLLSRQIEEEFRLRLEFKKIQKEFEEHQASFMNNEMKELGDKIAEYERIKENTDKLTDRMNDNYSEYMEFQKSFKRQQEEFYEKQVEFYEKINDNFNDQIKKYEGIKVNINEEVR